MEPDEEAASNRRSARSRWSPEPALLPGPTDTDFFERAGMQDTPVYEAKKDDPAEVAKDAIKAMLSGDAKVVAGSAKNAMQAATAKVLPDSAKAGIHAAQTKPEGVE